MCGRFALNASQTDVESFFNTLIAHDFPPRFNIKPTEPVLVISAPEFPRAEKSNLPDFDSHLVHWGFVPQWVKDFQSWPLTFNIRSETACVKKSFATAMQYRRVIFPVSGFYEWKKVRSGKSIPHYITQPDGSLMGLAGLMETWDTAEGSQLDTAAILTRQAQGDLKNIHHRQPVILHQKDFARWLNVRRFFPRDVIDLFSSPMTDLEIFPVQSPQNALAPVKHDYQDELSQRKQKQLDAKKQHTLF